jgi:hypothetical protein
MGEIITPQIKERLEQRLISSARMPFRSSN